MLRSSSFPLVLSILHELPLHVSLVLALAPSFLVPEGWTDSLLLFVL